MSLAVVLLLTAAPLRAQPIGRLPSLNSLFSAEEPAADEDSQPSPSDRPSAAEDLPPARHVIGIQGVTSEQVTVNRTERGITVVAPNRPLAEVLSTLAAYENLNLVLAAPANNLVTVSLTGQTLPEVLNALLASGGLTWTMRGDVIYVSPMTTPGAVAPEIQGRRFQVFELDYASALDVDIAVKGLLSPVGRSWVSQSSPTDNRRTKEVITVEDLPHYLARIEDYICQIDQPPRQVLIEVHVLQVELRDDNRHGVDFSHVASLGNLQLDFNTTGLANAAAPQAFFVQASGPNLTGLIEALKTTTDAKTLASPRIMALNGQESRLQVGEQLGFRVTTTTETSTLESVEFLNVGVVLTVTPHIARDGRVLMRIRPEVSSGSVNPGTGLPEEETTEVDTDVLLGSGQGMVIGGLIQETDDVTANKYLGLGDAKFIGPLFQRRQAIKARSEIIVALIPHVLPLPPGEQYRNDINFSRARDPLMVGPLCRYPRPYEPRLHDYKLNPRKLCHADQCGEGGCIGGLGASGLLQAKGQPPRGKTFANHVGAPVHVSPEIPPPSRIETRPPQALPIPPCDQTHQPPANYQSTPHAPMRYPLSRTAPLGGGRYAPSIQRLPHIALEQQLRR